VIGSVRFPVANPDFAASSSAPRTSTGIDRIFVPAVRAGSPRKALAERASIEEDPRSSARVRPTAEAALKSMGDASLGIITAWHYDYKADNARNREFVKVFNECTDANPDYLLDRRLRRHARHLRGDEEDRRQSRRRFADHRARLKWESPRGRCPSTPKQRDVVQNIYIRRVQRVGAS